MVERSTGSHDWHNRSRTPRGGEGWWSRVTRWWSQSSDWRSQGSVWRSQNLARSSADTSQERSCAPTEQLSPENMLVGMMSTVVENRQGAVSRAASYRCMYKCMMYVYLSQLINSLINEFINYHISTNMHSLIIINRQRFARWNCRPCAVTL